MSVLFRLRRLVHFRDSTQKKGMSYLSTSHEPWLVDLKAWSAIVEDPVPSLLKYWSILPYLQESLILAIIWAKLARVTSQYIPLRSALQTLPHLHLISHVVPSPYDSRLIFQNCFPTVPLRPPTSCSVITGEFLPGRKSGLGVRLKHLPSLSAEFKN
jgi:hypothetical protein